MSEYFTIKVCYLHLYDHIIKCRYTWYDMSEIPSVSWHSNKNIPGNVSNADIDVPIDTKLFTCEICTYNIKHFFWHMP